MKTCANLQFVSDNMPAGVKEFCSVEVSAVRFKMFKAATKCQLWRFQRAPTMRVGSKP